MNEFRKFWTAIVVGSLILVCVYLLGKIEGYVQQNLKFIIPLIVALHWFFFFCGCMLVGLPFTLIIRTLYLQGYSRIPKRFKSQIRESKRKFPLFHKLLDYFWWIAFLPAFIGLLILFIILPAIGIDINLLFLNTFYFLPIAGIFYLSFIYSGVVESVLELKQ